MCWSEALPDVAIVKAWKADTMGNLIFRKTARNFNPIAAMAGKITIAEAEEIVERESSIQIIHTPGIYVQHVELGASQENGLKNEQFSKHRERVRP